MIPENIESARVAIAQRKGWTIDPASVVVLDEAKVSWAGQAITTDQGELGLPERHLAFFAEGDELGLVHADTVAQLRADRAAHHRARSRYCN